MSKKPYKAKTITGAQARVRLLERQLAECHELLREFDVERKALAKLAANGPAFNSPLEAIHAEQVRDRILRRMNLNPDGSFAPFRHAQESV